MADYEIVRKGPAYETVEASTGNTVRVWSADGKIDRSKRVVKSAEISHENIQNKPRTRKDFHYGILAKGTQYYQTELQEKVERKKPRKTSNIREKREKAVREYNEELLTKSMKKLSIKKTKKAADTESEDETDEEEKENVQNKKTEIKKPVEKKESAKKESEEKPKETEPSQEVAASTTQVRRRKSGVKKQEKTSGLDAKAVKILEGHEFTVKPATGKKMYAGRAQPIPEAIEQFLDAEWNKKVLNSKKFNLEQLEIIDFVLPEDELKEQFPVLLNEKYESRYILIADGADACLMAMQDDTSSDFNVYILETGTEKPIGPIKITDLLASATFSEKVDESSLTNQSQIDE